MFQLQALIIENTILAPGYYLMSLLVPEVAAIALPGQFIQLRGTAPESLDPLLSRPISIYRIDPAAGKISIIFKTVGRGTRGLAEKRSGELVELMGPIGNGFQLPSSVTHLALIAGGIGMPPLLCLAEHLRRSQSAIAVSLFYGGRSRLDLLELQQWSQIGAVIHLATDDGSVGFHGVVTELFYDQHRRTPFDFLAACGPTPMLKSVQRLAVNENISGLLSLEAHMACGVGACLGCTCQTDQGYRRVCVDGPVFPVQEVTFS